MVDQKLAVTQGETRLWLPGLMCVKHNLYRYSRLLLSSSRCLALSHSAREDYLLRFAGTCYALQTTRPKINKLSRSSFPRERGWSPSSGKPCLRVPKTLHLSQVAFFRELSAISFKRFVKTATPNHWQFRPATFSPLQPSKTPETPNLSKICPSDCFGGFQSGGLKFGKICQNLSENYRFSNFDKFFQISVPLTGTPQNNRWDKFWTNLGFRAFLKAVRGNKD